MARRLVNAVLAWRKQRIKDGYSEEKVGTPAVDSELITLRSKGKLVARRPNISEKSTTTKTSQSKKSQTTIHMRRSASYG